MSPAAEIAPIDPHPLPVAEIQLFIVVVDNELFRGVHLALWNDDLNVAAVEVGGHNEPVVCRGDAAHVIQNNLSAAGEMSIPLGMGRLEPSGAEARAGSGTLLPMPMSRM